MRKTALVRPLLGLLRQPLVPHQWQGVVEGTEGIVQRKQHGLVGNAQLAKAAGRVGTVASPRRHWRWGVGIGEGADMAGWDWWKL